MTDISHLDSLYDKLFASIDNLFKTDETIKANKVEIDSLTNFLCQNEAEIGKYRSATMELQVYLDAYDFAKGSLSENMKGIRRKVEALHPLRLKLVQMGEEAKKLSAYPDRYNSKKAIETCKNLVLVCREKMRIDESGKVMQLVETNTKKLIELRELLERDNEILRQIKAAIDADKMVLEKFKEYYAELQQFVTEFPHGGQDDLAVVTRRISSAKNLMAMYAKMDKEVATIKDYSNRYNKEMVINHFLTITQAMFSSMKYSDVGRVETQLMDIQKQVQAVRNAFNFELQDLDTLKASLMSRRSDIWKEDNERLLTTVSGLLSRDTRREIFDINRLKSDYSSSKSKRLTEINDTKNRFPWLESRKRYKTAHDTIVSRYIESLEYRAKIKILVRDRILRHILICIPVLGWIILLNMKEVTI